MKVHLYTDGACSPNPGVGGYGYVAIINENVWCKRFGGCTDTTNNLMEMSAVINGLNSLPKDCTVEVFSDSKYVINCATLKWKINKNEKAWGKLFQAIRRHKDVIFTHIKGHNGNKFNEEADRLAVKGRLKIRG